MWQGVYSTRNLAIIHGTTSSKTEVPQWHHDQDDEESSRVVIAEAQSRKKGVSLLFVCEYSKEKGLMRLAHVLSGPGSI
jgi:hypothetical protein